MDTQGVFDPDTTVEENTSIFSFSVLASSVQIFNMQGQINGDDLGYLEMYSQYGKLLVDEGNVPNGQSGAFQDLVFLIRDWRNIDARFPYGWEGGKRVLER